MQSLKFGDRPAELLALLGIIQRQTVSTLSDAEGHRRGADTLAVIGGHEIGEALLQAAWWQHQRISAQHHVLHQDFAFRDAAKTHGLLAPPDA